MNLAYKKAIEIQDMKESIRKYRLKYLEARTKFLSLSQQINIKQNELNDYIIEHSGEKE